MADDEQTIRVQENGPYVVRGDLPLVRKEPVVSEHGEPLTWRSPEPLEAKATYALCRCGASGNKPFCDGSHKLTDFDGSGPATQADYEQRRKAYEGPALVVYDDRSICVHAGFCGDRLTNVWKLVGETDDTAVRARVMAMVERCPSGALTYALDANDEPIEPHLPNAIAVTPDGPLWVTGGVAVELPHGRRLERRNRVTLCRCGASGNKPLCDGSHKAVAFTDSPTGDEEEV